jgi:hypothetical protein
MIERIGRTGLRNVKKFAPAIAVISVAVMASASKYETDIVEKCRRTFGEKKDRNARSIYAASAVALCKSKCRDQFLAKATGQVRQPTNGIGHSLRPRHV